MTGPAGVDRLEAQGITVACREAVVLAGVDLTVPSGVVTAIVGANGSGKSTLLRALARLGILPQGPVAPDGLTVRDLVRRGRHPHLRWYERWRRADEQAVDAALQATGLATLAGLSLGTLSGGQRQKAWIAMALAQETRILLLDESTTYLDIAHQLDADPVSGAPLVVPIGRVVGQTAAASRAR